MVARSARLLIAVFAAPIAASLPAAAVYVIYSAMTCCAPITDWLNTFFWIFVTGAFFSLFAIAGAATIGLLVHTFLMRAHRRGPFVYVAAGAATGVIFALPFGAPFTPNPADIFPMAVMPFAVSIGALSALFAWLIRRPDRDAPPNPPTSAP